MLPFVSTAQGEGLTTHKLVFCFHIRVMCCRVCSSLQMIRNVFAGDILDYVLTFTSLCKDLLALLDCYIQQVVRIPLHNFTLKQM